MFRLGNEGGVPVSDRPVPATNQPQDEVSALLLPSHCPPLLLSSIQRTYCEKLIRTVTCCVFCQLQKLALSVTIHAKELYYSWV